MSTRDEMEYGYQTMCSCRGVFIVFTQPFFYTTVISIPNINGFFFNEFRELQIKETKHKTKTQKENKHKTKTQKENKHETKTQKEKKHETKTQE